MKLKKPSLNFLSNNRQVFFSVAVIILVPLLVVLNTYFLINSMQKNMDQELRDKAITVGQGLDLLLGEDNVNEEYFLSKIKDYSQATESVKNITIVEKDGDNFRNYVSLDPEKTTEKVTDPDKTLYVLSWYQNNPVAKEFVSGQNLIFDGKRVEYGERLWSVTLPLGATVGSKTYLANVWVSTSNIDALTTNTTNMAVLFLVATIITIVVLIFSNGKLFEYSILFAKLKEVDQMKDDFISIASHELRTPLAAIKGSIEMISDDESTSNKLTKEQKKEMLEDATISANRLDSLVADILDVSRIEQQRMSFELKKVNLADKVRATVKTLSVQAKDKKLKIIENYPKEAVYSEVDDAKLDQVLVNIIGNAIKYTKEGEVEITVETEEKFNKINVRDTGVGMSEEERKNLFTKFYRIQNDDTKDIVGTGLGLWITKEMVEKMNGKIMVDSIKDVGSQFTILFPVLKKTDNV